MTKTSMQDGVVFPVKVYSILFFHLVIVGRPAAEVTFDDNGINDLYQKAVIGLERVASQERFMCVTVVSLW